MMVQLDLRHILENRVGGDLLSDVPQKLNWDELCVLVVNRNDWRQRVKELNVKRGFQRNGHHDSYNH